MDLERHVKGVGESSDEQVMSWMLTCAVKWLDLVELADVK